MKKQTEKFMGTLIEEFLERFPKNATCWSKATDEVRDLSRTSREYLEEYDGVIVNPIEFRSLKTPAEWNTKGRDSIMANFERMQPKTKKAFFCQWVEWFLD